MTGTTLPAICSTSPSISGAPALLGCAVHSLISRCHLFFHFVPCILCLLCRPRCVSAWLVRCKALHPRRIIPSLFRVAGTTVVGVTDADTLLFTTAGMEVVDEIQLHKALKYCKHELPNDVGMNIAEFTLRCNQC